jgi:hypothetical protein
MPLYATSEARRNCVRIAHPKRCRLNAGLTPRGRE